jgi:Zinc knuckle
MNSSRLCRVCGEEGHLSVKCKELYSPPDGELYTGAGCGADDHDHDDETLAYEHWSNNILFTVSLLFSQIY